jgi:hypothetical protein
MYQLIVDFGDGMEFCKDLQSISLCEVVKEAYKVSKKGTGYSVRLQCLVNPDKQEKVWEFEGGDVVYYVDGEYIYTHSIQVYSLV